MGDAQRFDESCLVERDVADLVDPATVDDDLLAESATAAGQADEPHLRTQVVVARLARGALVADEVRLDDNIFTDLDVRDTFADLFDGAGELVAHRDRRILV